MSGSFKSVSVRRWRRALILFLMLFVYVPFHSATPAAAQVSTGAGSYATTLPAGATAPQATIYKTANVTTKMPTNEWWSSLAFKRYSDHHSENMFPHPLSVKAKADGLGLGYPNNQTVTGDGRKYEYVYTEDLTVGTVGLNTASTDVKVDGFSEWTVTADWSAGQLKATVGHGMPFVYFTKTGANALVKFNAVPSVQSNSGGAVHIIVNGRAYGLFAPAGSTWTQTGNNFESSLNGQDYFSVAALPDSTPATFNDFKAHAMAFVTSTVVSWNYNATTAQVTTTYTFTTVVKEGSETRPLFALYPHQWENTSDVNTAYTYVSPRGTMKVVRGTSFATTMKFSGVLPWLPDLGAYDRTQLYNYINDIYLLNDDGRLHLPGPGGEWDTYWTGKGLGRLAMLVPIAEQIGHTAARDAFLQTLKSRLQNWYTASSGETGTLFYYDNNWGTLIGYPANYGSDVDLNDHHFHYGYFVVASAIVSLYDHTWSNSSNWGPMTDLLIKDASNWDIGTEPRFPRLRNFDPYAGHAWASGSQPFAAGNNQESSSESINYSYGLILWGSATGNTAIRDLGIYMYTTEVAAVEDYWFDVHNNIFPNTGYSHNYIGLLWGDGSAYATWWTGNPEEIHGINILPVTAGSLYLGKYPSYVDSFYNEMVANNGGTEFEWSDIIWEYQAFSNPESTWTKFGAGTYSGAAQEWGETKAHTYHWLGNLKNLGTFTWNITGNNPLSAVFTKGGVKTYVAYNASGSPIVVNFSDGTNLPVPAWSMATSNGNPPTATPTATSTTTATATNTATSIPGLPDTIGVYNTGLFYLRNSNSPGAADIVVAFGGDASDLPVAGDWNSDGVDTIGVYRGSTGVYFLSDSNTTPTVSHSLVFGNPGDTPFAGKWTSGATHDGVGVYRNSDGILYQKDNLTTGFSDYFAIFGNPGDQGYGGDFNGNSFDSIGVYRATDQTWFMTNNSQPSGITFSDISFAWNIGTARPVIGDWNADVTSTVGFLTSTGVFVLHSANAASGTDNTFAFGPANGYPIAGKWVASSQPPKPGLVIAPVQSGGTNQTIGDGD